MRVTLDATGTTTNTYDYEPFGGILNSGVEARQGFNSREKDQESDLFNNGVRKLSDDFGRFTSVDPLWEEFDGWSPYQYGYNNPLTVTDPSGMQGVDISLTPSIPAYPTEGMGAGPTTGSATPTGEKTTVPDRPLVIADNTSVQSSGWIIPDNSINYDEGNVIREVVGGGLVRAGQPTVPTRAKFKDAIPGTSPASETLRKKFPKPIRSNKVKIPIGNILKGIRWVPAKTVGTALGRLVPWVGWGILIWDVVDLTVGIISGNELEHARQHSTTIGLYNTDSFESIKEATEESQPID